MLPGAGSFAVGAILAQAVVAAGAVIAQRRAAVHAALEAARIGQAEAVPAFHHCHKYQPLSGTVHCARRGLILCAAVAQNFARGAQKGFNFLEAVCVAYQVTVYPNGREDSSVIYNGVLYLPDLALDADLPSGAWLIGHKCALKATGGNDT